MNQKPEPQPDGTPFDFEGVIEIAPQLEAEGWFCGKWKNGGLEIEHMKIWAYHAIPTYVSE